MCWQTANFYGFDRYKRLDLRKTRQRSSFWKIANSMSKKKNTYISACREFQFYDTSICQYMYFVFPHISTSSFLNWILTRFHYSYCRKIILQLFLFLPSYNGCMRKGYMRIFLLYFEKYKHTYRFRTWYLAQTNFDLCTAWTFLCLLGQGHLKFYNYDTSVQTAPLWMAH